jgi:glycosyltransferase involved in cell wall biosynthesis
MTYADVTVITPCIERRLTDMLPECIASVRAQTVQPAAHFIGVDYSRRGNGRLLNELVAGVTTEWIVMLADDDLLYPEHLERCLTAQAGVYDVVYPYADLSDWPERSFIRRAVNKPWVPGRIMMTNWIAGSAVLLRTSMYRFVGGISEDPEHVHCNDWKMWQDIEREGGKFFCLPEVLWRYRHHPHQMQAACDGRTGTDIREWLAP